MAGRFAAVALIGTSILLLAGVRSTQAAEIKIVSPSAYEDIEGEGSVGGSFPPYRYQQVFPAADFAALGNQPHFLVSHTARPDQSLTSPRTVHFPDIEIRLSTMPVGPPNLSLDFDDNLGSDVMQYYRGPLNWVTVDAGPRPGPREFYHAEFPAGVTPFLYDPSQGNLLLDVITWQGSSPTTRSDNVPGIQTSLFAFNPLVATQGIRGAASVFQFTFVPVPEPSTALLVLIGSLALAARCRPTHVRLRR